MNALIQKASYLPKSPLSSLDHKTFSFLECKPTPVVRPTPLHEFYGSDPMLSHVIFLSALYFSNLNLNSCQLGWTSYYKCSPLTPPHHTQCLSTDRLDHRLEWVIQTPKNILWATHRGEWEGAGPGVNNTVLQKCREKLFGPDKLLECWLSSSQQPFPIHIPKVSLTSQRLGILSAEYRRIT